MNDLLCVTEMGDKMQITDEQIDAIYDESPFIARRRMDKSGYEVVQMMNDDWREVITNDPPKHCGYFATYEDAETAQRRLHVRWVLSDA